MSPSCSSVSGQAAGQLPDLPSQEERRRLHPGEGLHGESVHLRAGQSFLPGLVSNGKQREFSPGTLQLLALTVFILAGYLLGCLCW